MKNDLSKEASGKAQSSKRDGGTTPSISLLLDELPCAPPGGRVMVNWRAEPDDVVVEVAIEDDETQYACITNQPNVGTLEWIVPRSMDTVTELTITATAAASGEVVTESLPFLIGQKPKLLITGMEVTQGIQWFDPTYDFLLPGGGLKVFAHKDTIVRVYISADRGGINNDLVEDVTGTLEIDGVALSPINGQVPASCGSWSGGNPFITARPADEVDGEQTGHTLNFRIPAAMATPNFHKLEASITSPEFCGETADSFQIYRKWWPARALPVRYVRVKADHPSTGTNTMPTVEEAECTILRAFDLLPSPATDIGPAKLLEITTLDDLNDSAGMFHLWQLIEYSRRDCSLWESFWGGFFDVDCSEYDSSSIWIGLHNSGFMGGAITDDNTCIAPAYNPLTHGQTLAPQRIVAAHEIGHCLGFEHVHIDCPTLGVYVPHTGSYYEPANNGLLWAIPFDPFWNNAASGDVADFMSYACKAWTSGDSWNQLHQWIG